MSDFVRMFTVAGNSAFLEFLRKTREEPATPLPIGLLNDPSMSQVAPFSAKIERHPGGASFTDRYSFGRYLVDALRQADRAEISLLHGLWNWLSLYFFDQLCPPATDGTRALREVSVYFLPERFQHNRYYRHLVRTPWLAVSMHPVSSRVILIPISTKGAPLAVTGEIFEQVASRQGIFRSRNIMSAIDLMYFDSVAGRPRNGTGGSAGGSPRRLGQILKQFELTFDLEFGEDISIVSLLPKEFGAWTKRARASPV